MRTPSVPAGIVVGMEDSAPARRTGSIQVLQRASAIMEVVANSETTMSSTQLAREVGLNKSTAFNILSTLVELGFLTITPEERHYRLGPRLFQLANAFQSPFQLASIAGPYLYALRDATGESVSLHVRSGWDRVCIDQAQSLQSIVRVLELGRRRPLYAGAAGHVLLSGLDDARIKAYLGKVQLEALTPHTTIDAGKLLERIAGVREAGYAEAHEESELGVSALAVPLRDQRGAIDAALVVSGPAGRFDRTAVQQALDVTRSTAAEISRERGGVETAV